MSSCLSSCIHFDNIPTNELYVIINKKVISILLEGRSKTSGYLAQISCPNGEKNNFKKTLKFLEIEDNVKFRLEHIFYLFQETWKSRKVFSRKHEQMTQMHQKYQWTFKNFPLFRSQRLSFVPASHFPALVTFIFLEWK